MTNHDQDNGTVMLLRIDDVRKVFKCGRKKAYQIMHIPGFPSFKLDGVLYVEADALKKWISKCANKNIFTN